MDGKVLAASTDSGNPLLRAAAVIAARQTTFAPTLINGARIYVVAYLVYNFNADGTGETDIRDEKKLIGEAINLPKPPFPSCNCKFGKKSTVIVQAEIDEKGNVTSSKAISGHPILKQASEQAARFAKFSETKISGVSVKARVSLTYEFSTDDGSVNVTVNSVQPIEQ